jgi:hypothetical protein
VTKVSDIEIDTRHTPVITNVPVSGLGRERHFNVYRCVDCSVISYMFFFPTSHAILCYDSRYRV